MHSPNPSHQNRNGFVVRVHNLRGSFVGFLLFLEHHSDGAETAIGCPHEINYVPI